MNLLPKSLRLVLPFVLLTVLGCGLTEYEDKMKQTQKRLERFDEEKRLLDEPVQLPRKKVKDKDKVEHEVALAPIFLRPPLGIQKKATGPEQGILFRFLRAPPKEGAPPGNPPAAPAAPVTPFIDVALAWVESDKVEQPKFVQEVLQKIPRKDPGTVLTPVLDQGPRQVETYEFYDPADNFCSVSFRSKGKLRVAAVYRVEKGKKTVQTDRAIKCSVETLAIEDECEPAEKLYAMTHPRSAPAPAAPAPAAPAPQPSE